MLPENDNNQLKTVFFCFICLFIGVLAGGMIVQGLNEKNVNQYKIDGSMMFNKYQYAHQTRQLDIISDPVKSKTVLQQQATNAFDLMKKKGDEKLTGYVNDFIKCANGKEWYEAATEDENCMAIFVNLEERVYEVQKPLYTELVQEAK